LIASRLFASWVQTTSKSAHFTPLLPGIKQLWDRWQFSFHEIGDGF
jgi:hypothetical protein